MEFSLDAFGSIACYFGTKSAAASCAKPDSFAELGAPLASAYSDCRYVRIIGAGTARIEWLLLAVAYWGDRCSTGVCRRFFYQKFARYGIDRDCGIDAVALYIAVCFVTMFLKTKSNCQ